MQHRALQAKEAANIAEDELQKCQDLEPLTPLGDVMCSQLDPFGVIIRPDMPKHALQMFHHSMWYTQIPYTVHSVYSI